MFNLVIFRISVSLPFLPLLRSIFLASRAAREPSVYQLIVKTRSLPSVNSISTCFEGTEKKSVRSKSTTRERRKN